MTFPLIFSYLKRNYILTISGFVVIVCACVHFVRNEQIERLEANYDDLNIRRSRVLKNFKFGADLERDLVEMRVMQEDAESRLFREENLAVNQRYFYQVESATNVKLMGLQQNVKPIPKGKANKKAAKKAAKSKYREIIYDMTVTGTYLETLNFMRELEGGKAFIRLVSLSMVPSRSSKNKEVTVSLSVEVLGVKS